MKRLFRISFQSALVLLALTAPLARALPVEGTLLGQAPYAFSLPSLDGGTTKLADAAGARALVLVFWGSWSPNAALELAELEKLYGRWKDQKLRVLAIAVDNQTMGPADVQAVRALRDRLSLTFPVLLDQQLATFKEYGVVAVPSTVLVSGDGKVVYTLAGYPLSLRGELLTRIEALITGVDPTAPAKTVYRPAARAIRWYNLGRQQLRLGLPAVAEARLEEAIKADPKFAAPLTLLGQIRLDGGRLPEAEQALRQAIALDADDRAAWAELGRLLIDTGKPSEARQALERAVALDAGYTPAHWYLGLLAGREGKAAAEVHFKAAEELNAREPRLYLYRGRVAEGQGRVDAALADYRRALDLLLPESAEE